MPCYAPETVRVINPRAKARLPCSLWVFRRLSLFAGVALLALSVLHLAVLAAWRFSVLPELASLPKAELLSAAFARSLPQAPGSWPIVEVLGVRMRVPARTAGAITQLPCKRGCQLLFHEGWLRVKPRQRAETYWDTVFLLAPDSEDVSFRHPPWRNWSAMLALSRRVRQHQGARATWRFDARGSHGVVTSYASREILRHVVYAYSYTGQSTPPLLFSRVQTHVLLAILGSLEISADEAAVN
jgi:hypothetical protein